MDGKFEMKSFCIYDLVKKPEASSCEKTQEETEEGQFLALEVITINYHNAKYGYSGSRVLLVLISFFLANKQLSRSQEYSSL